jgi:hypothetical protein
MESIRASLVGHSVPVIVGKGWEQSEPQSTMTRYTTLNGVCCNVQDSNDALGRTGLMEGRRLLDITIVNKYISSHHGIYTHRGYPDHNHINN